MILCTRRIQFWKIQLQKIKKKPCFNREICFSSRLPSVHVQSKYENHANFFRHLSATFLLKVQKWWKQWSFFQIALYLWKYSFIHVEWSFDNRAEDFGLNFQKFLTEISKRFEKIIKRSIKKSKCCSGDAKCVFENTAEQKSCWSRTFSVLNPERLKKVLRSFLQLKKIVRLRREQLCQPCWNFSGNCLNIICSQSKKKGNEKKFIKGLFSSKSSSGLVECGFHNSGGKLYPKRKFFIPLKSQNYIESVFLFEKYESLQNDALHKQKAVLADLQEACDKIRKFDACFPTLERNFLFLFEKFDFVSFPWNDPLYK